MHREGDDFDEKKAAASRLGGPVEAPLFQQLDRQRSRTLFRGDSGLQETVTGSITLPASQPIRAGGTVRSGLLSGVSSAPTTSPQPIARMPLGSMGELQAQPPLTQIHNSPHAVVGSAGNLQAQPAASMSQIRSSSGVSPRGVAGSSESLKVGSVSAAVRAATTVVQQQQVIQSGPVLQRSDSMQAQPVITTAPSGSGSILVAAPRAVSLPGSVAVAYPPGASSQPVLPRSTSLTMSPVVTSAVLPSTAASVQKVFGSVPTTQVVGPGAMSLPAAVRTSSPPTTSPVVTTVMPGSGGMNPVLSTSGVITASASQPPTQSATWPAMPTPDSSPTRRVIVAGVPPTSGTGSASFAQFVRTDSSTSSPQQR